MSRHVILIAAAMLVLGQRAAAGQPACSEEQGQRFIDEGRYQQATKEFTCLIEAQPTELEGYRGRIEAQLLLGSYSNALRDYGRVTALVLPVHPDAAATIFAGYDARLAAGRSLRQPVPWIEPLAASCNQGAGPG